MALKAIVTSISDVPDPLREHYAEKDGKFILSVESVGGVALEDVGGLRTALSKERESRQIAEKTIKAWEGLDPDDTRERLAKYDELSKLDPTKEADRIVSERVKAWGEKEGKRLAAEIGTRDQKIGKLESAYRKVTVTQAATQAISEAKGRVKPLLPHVEAVTRVRETADGSYAVEVLDAAGNVRIGDSQGNSFTIAQLVAEMKSDPEFAPLFEGHNAAGSGATSGGANRNAAGAHSGAGQQNQTPTQRIAEGLRSLGKR